MTPPEPRRTLREVPLFRRPDAELVRGVPPVRAVMPYLMRGRNESAVLQESTFVLDRTRPWLRAYNRSHAERATLFHLFAFACARALQQRPELNRFVSGGRLYQRREVSLAFVVKREMRDDAPFASVKLTMPSGEAFPAFVARAAAAIHEARTRPRAIDREVALVMRLPGPLLRAGVWLVRALDAWNLLPGWFTRDDPMHASLFLANLGSAGISDAWHHLFEYGTTSIFGTLSAPRRTAFVEGDRVVVRDGVSVRWTFDERIQDGLYGSRSLALAQRVLEDPAGALGAPDGPAAPEAPARG